MRPSGASLGQAIALTVATILGTGILGLPVSLNRSGLQPFLVLFTFNLFAQIAVIYTGCELLLRAYKLNRSDSVSKQQELPTIKQSQTEEGEEKSENVVYSSNSLLLSGNGEQKEDDDESPSLHSLADYFIKNKVLKLLFNLFVMLHFIFILVTYVLAAPQAYATIIPIIQSVPVFMRTTFFLLLLSLIVYLLPSLLLPFLSFGTLFKGVLLTILIILTFITGLTIQTKSISNWTLSYLVDPLLMSTMALSGIINVMPVTFQACLKSLQSSEERNKDNLVDKDFISYYRLACVTGVVLCFFMNIIWCFAVLMVVPQTSNELSSSATLQYANEQGLISTIPLMEVLTLSDNKLNSIIGFLINLFIAISLTISFLVVSLAMLHYINGSVTHSNAPSSTSSSFFKSLVQSRFVRFWLGGVLFIYVFAILNPKGVLKIMEGITTLALNCEAGVFVVYMFHQSRLVGNNYHEEDQEDPSNAGYLSNSVAKLCTTYMVVFFSIIVLVDLLFYLPKSF